MKEYDSMEDALADIMSKRTPDKQELPVLNELKCAGFDIVSVWDFVNGPNDYYAAVPILVDHLRKGYSFRLEEALVRALTVPRAGDEAFEVLNEKFSDFVGTSEELTAATAVTTVAEKRHLEVLKRLTESDLRCDFAILEMLGKIATYGASQEDLALIESYKGRDSIRPKVEKIAARLRKKLPQ